MFFRKRHLGVKEANAIDAIIVYEWKRDRGLLITTPEKFAYQEAWQVVERREPLTVAEAARKMRAVIATKEVSSYEDDEYEDEDEDDYDEENASPSPVVDDVPFKTLVYIVAGLTIWVILASIYGVLT